MAAMRWDQRDELLCDDEEHVDEDEDDDEAEANSPERVLDPHMLVELDPLLTSDRIGVDSEVWDVSAAPVAAAGRERTSHRT